LQITIKVINDTIGLNELILTLLIFGIYPKITKLDPSNLLIEQCIVIIKKVIKEVRKIYIIRKINDALVT
jgi:hypothetical protein